MPTIPALVTINLVSVDEPITNEGAAPFVAVGLIENCAHGVEDPSERKPVDPV